MGGAKKDKAIYHQAEQEILQDKIQGFISINNRLPDIMDESRLLDEISEELINERVKKIRDNKAEVVFRSDNPNSNLH